MNNITVPDLTTPLVRVTGDRYLNSCKHWGIIIIKGTTITTTTTTIYQIYSQTRLGLSNCQRLKSAARRQILVLQIPYLFARERLPKTQHKMSSAPKLIMQRHGVPEKLCKPQIWSYLSSAATTTPVYFKTARASSVAGL